MHPLLLNAIDLVEASASSAVYCIVGGVRRPSVRYGIDRISNIQDGQGFAAKQRLSVEHRLQACGLLWVVDRGQTDIINESIKLVCTSHT